MLSQNLVRRGGNYAETGGEFVPFLSYPAELRRMLYTTNAVESLNSQLRKTLRQRGPFPNDEAVFKLLYLAIRNAKVHWSRPIAWTRMLFNWIFSSKDVCPPESKYTGILTLPF